MRPALVILASLLIAACSKSMESQQADLAFWFRCSQPATPEMEQKIAGFLGKQGFRVLNLGALQRNAGIELYDLNMTAIDAMNRTISIHGFKHTPGSQAVGLYSPPPTLHDYSLEEALLSFVSKGLDCSTEQVARHFNGPEAADMHNWNVRRIERLFKEAAELEGA